MKYAKADRQKKLMELLEENPLFTDRELADYFDVSIQTIRLDRMSMGIPEVRERTKNAASAYARLKSVSKGEVIGELVVLELNRYSESVMVTTPEMALERSKIIRGHFIFAQANSLAVALIDARNVLTGKANLTFHKIVHIGDKITARAVVKKKEKYRFLVQVNSYKDDELVFSGDFVLFAKEEVD
ncbi:MAG: transcription factor FapR [Halanaerobiaceae bacterium]|jgi:acyl-coenzyme A thioesterase PaaI-like protein|nr:transcription factor FapR [Halanaerobiaceae bacterium]